MTWTYVLPIATPKDEVRFFSGDTDESRPLVQDEEIFYVLSKQPSVQLAAAIVCDAIVGKLSQNTDARVGDVSESSSQAVEAFRKKASDLRKEAAKLALPIFGGVFKTQKDALDDDVDLVQPSFRIGQDDHPEIQNERDGLLYREEWQ